MITYSFWKDYTRFDKYTDNFEKISTYAFLAFMSIIIIPIDVLSSPFQLIGITIFLITNKKKKK